MGALAPIRPRAERRVLHARLPFSLWLSVARRASALALVAAIACDDDPVAPEPFVPFADARYALVALDGQPLPVAFEYHGSTYLLNAATLEFVDDTTVRWRLDDLTPVPPETVPLSIVGSFRYRQTGPDSLELSGETIGPFSISPWGYGRRTDDTLALRTVDPVPSDPRLPDVAESPFGVHLWRFRTD